MLSTFLNFADFISKNLKQKGEELSLKVPCQITVFSHGELMQGECSVPRDFANLKNI